MNDNEYFVGFEPRFALTDRILPSYNDLLEKNHGNLFIKELIRKKNRNVLLCICSCGREELIYRWQLKDRLSCSVCGIYTDEYIQKNSQIKREYFDSIQKYAECNNIKFEVSYEYTCKIFQDQSFKCKLSGIRLVPYLHVNDYNGTAILDQIDNKLGFIEGNIQWVHKDIFYMKRNVSSSFFLSLCEKVVEFNKGKKNDITDILFK